MSEPLLVIKDLVAGIEGKQILNGINLTINPGEIHAIMGPNGSGKSTLSKVVAGHPAFSVTSGSILFKGKDITPLDPSERAKAGVFLAFQYPVDIPGVTNLNFLRSAYIERSGKEIPVLEFRKLLLEKMSLLGMDASFATRAVNVGFSGGEKKRNEILQMALLNPSLAVLDETDSGLDIDALRVVAQGVNSIVSQGSPAPGVLLITHYNRLLSYIKPHFVHVLAHGRIIRSGGPDLARELEDRGYDWVVGEAIAVNG